MAYKPVITARSGGKAVAKDPWQAQIAETQPLEGVERTLLCLHRTASEVQPAGQVGRSRARVGPGRTRPWQSTSLARRENRHEPNRCGPGHHHSPGRM